MKRTPLKRKTPLRRTTRLKPQSAKRAVQNAAYYKERDFYLGLVTICERCKQRWSCDIHHKAGRIGALLCDMRYFAAVCRVCHDQIHQNMNQARKDGWILDL